MAQPRLEKSIWKMTKDAKRTLFAFIGTLPEDFYEFYFFPRRATRSVRANAFYWASIVSPFFEYLRQQDPRIIDKEQAHYWLKAANLPTVRMVDPKTGEEKEIVGTTHNLPTDEFCLYIDRCRFWLEDRFDIVTLDRGEHITAAEPKGAEAA